MPITVENIGRPVDSSSLAEWVRTATIATAERTLIDAVGRGFDNQPVVVTDGMPRRDYALVKPYGRIEFIRRPQMTEAVLWALDELRKRSPVLTGRYVSSHILLLNGVQITGDPRAELAKVKDIDRVQIVNTQPYARKIEGATANKRTGRGKRKPSSRQARNGVYRAVLTALVQRYGRSLFFDYKLVKLNLGVKVWCAIGGARGRTPAATHRKRVLRDQVYPALQFYIKPTGLPN